MAKQFEKLGFYFNFLEEGTKSRHFNPVGELALHKMVRNEESEATWGIR